jgi:hypothetical protein
MRYLLISVVAALAVAIAPDTASADMADCSKRLERTYSKSYKKVANKHGKRAPGRNIRKNGVLFRKVVFNATCGELRRSRSQLKKLLRPPFYTLVTSNVPPAQPPAGVHSAEQTGAFNGWAIPEYIVMCESGGDFNARNPSGAYGAYQIMPGTAAGYGCDLSTPAGQHRCAAKIYAAEGASPWVCG